MPGAIAGLTLVPKLVEMEFSSDGRLAAGGLMRSASTWFTVLTLICIIGPYLLGVRPRTRRHWLYITLTIAFIAWLLPLMDTLRSR